MLSYEVMKEELSQQDLGNKRSLEDKEEEDIDDPLGLEPWWLEDQGSLHG